MPRSALLGLIFVSSSLAMGCSEPVPAAARGAAYVAFSTLGQCNVGKPHNGRIGFVNTQEVLDLAQDTVAGARLFCSISGSGTFSVEGFMTLGTTHIEYKINEISNANDSEANAALGSLAYSHVETVNQYVSPTETPCEFWVNTNNGQGVQSGEMWVEFKCAEIKAASINSTCGISVGSTLTMADCEE